MKAFAQYIDDGVKALGTSKALALRLGTNEPHLSAAKSGKRGMKEDACLELAEIIGVPFGKIIAAREAATAKTKEERQKWERYLAHSAVFVLVIMSMSDTSHLPYLFGLMTYNTSATYCFRKWQVIFFGLLLAIDFIILFFEFFLVCSWESRGILPQ